MPPGRIRTHDLSRWAACGRSPANVIYIYMCVEHLFLMFLDHTQRCSIVGRTPLDEWSARRHRPLTCCDRGFESHRGHGYLSVVSVVCCQVEVSATSWSLVQRRPTDCGASFCVIYKHQKRVPHIYIYIYIYIYDISSLRVNIVVGASKLRVKCDYRICIPNTCIITIAVTFCKLSTPRNLAVSHFFYSN